MTLRRHRTLEFTTDEDEYDWVWAEQEALRELRSRIHQLDPGGLTTTQTAPDGTPSAW